MGRSRGVQIRKDAVQSRGYHRPQRTSTFADEPALAGEEYSDVS
jgi:hypothetical protein